jgi:hypothetical protein
METEATPALPIQGGCEFEEGSANLPNNSTFRSTRTLCQNLTFRATAEVCFRVRIRTYGHAERFDLSGDGDSGSRETRFKQRESGDGGRKELAERDGTVGDRNRGRTTRYRSYDAIRHSGRHTRVRIRTYGHAGRFDFSGAGSGSETTSLRSHDDSNGDGSTQRRGLLAGSAGEGSFVIITASCAPRCLRVSGRY